MASYLDFVHAGACPLILVRRDGAWFLRGMLPRFRFR